MAKDGAPPAARQQPQALPGGAALPLLSARGRPRLAWRRLLPQTLLGRLTLVMLFGVLLTQLVGNAFWSMQRQREAEQEAQLAARHVAQSAISTMRYVTRLPANYRPILLQQIREFGGTRFFLNLNRKALPVQAIPASALSETALATVRATLQQELPRDYRIAFAWPGELALSDAGATIAELPESWVQHILVVKPKPAPILVIQAELEPGHWFYMATLMPNPYFLDGHNPLSRDRLLLLALSLAAVLLLSLLAVRWTTRPLAVLSDAVEAFGKGETEVQALPETGSREFVNTTRAFGAMRERIARYLADRDRLFLSISHDLRTPITRLRLRGELLDDDDLRNAFLDDADELDILVKGALQCVRDTDIHENPTTVRIDAMLERMLGSARMEGRARLLACTDLTVMAKPFALKRAIANVLDELPAHGQPLEVSTRADGAHVDITICAYPGPIGDSDTEALLSSLSLARSITEAHGGALLLEVRPSGGMHVTLRLPEIH
ncbi:HAMP domain-containing protein [Oxalobacteraceae bacterium]|nr:HAMP domain-containing protein [Oxalobacteraceae bacterium]